MAGGWLFPAGTPRVMDLDVESQNAPIVGPPVLVKSGILWVQGISVHNPTVDDGRIVFTTAAGRLVWQFNLIGISSDLKRFELEPLIGLYVLANVASLHYHVWGWKS